MKSIGNMELVRQFYQYKYKCQFTYCGSNALYYNYALILSNGVRYLVMCCRNFILFFLLKAQLFQKNPWTKTFFQSWKKKMISVHFHAYSKKKVYWVPNSGKSGQKKCISWKVLKMFFLLSRNMISKGKKMR